MTTAFQQSAFQDNAFQIDDGGVQPVVVRQPRGSGGYWKRKELRQGGLIYWPLKPKKKVEAVAEVVTEVLEDAVAEVPRQIDVGALAGALIQTHSYAVLKQVESHEEMLALIKREMDEWDDEEALLWLL